MIAAPSPSPAPAWVNDHRHAGCKRTYFACFPEQRVSLWGCSLCAGSALPTGSCDQPLLPAGDGLLLAGLHRPGRQLCPACARLETVPVLCRSHTALRPRRGLQLQLLLLEKRQQGQQRIAQLCLLGCYIATTCNSF